MNNIIVGLSGHIDHGKTSFIKAINHYDGDERSDEKERGMTIDISFSHIILGNNNISFIDVPGHEKLVKNMISGAFGVDVLALIVAGDDGIMPQSIEHLHIAKLLGITRILVFITKCDLISKDRILEVKKQVKTLLDELKLDLIEMSEFSIYDEDSINKAKKILSNLTAMQKQTSSFFRYYCDRVFSKKGFGTIVTGTILSGEIKKNDKVIICELNKEATIKHIHNHDKEVESTQIAQRIAFNLSISHEMIKKGMLLSKKGILRGFNKIDCVVFPLQKIINGQHISFFIGSKRMNASINILEKCDDKLFATLNLEEPIFGIFKERFILRDNAKTIGGGMILNPITDPMKKAQKLEYLYYLFDDNFIDAFKILVNAHKCGFGLIQSLQRFNLTHKESIEIAKKINDIFVDENAFVVYSLEVRNIIKETILNLIKKNKNAIFSATSINNQIKWSSLSFTQSLIDELEQNAVIQKSNENLYISSKSDIGDIFTYAKDSIIKELELGNITPEAPYNIYNKLCIDRKLGDSVLKYLTKSRKVIRLNHNFFILTNILNNMMESLRKIIKNEGYIDIPIFKKHYNISRKYIICYLDYLDNYGDIMKIDNKRMLLKSQ
ncbi:selenocysteine-specific translation elongation factor [Helicobacter sp. 16-1353]|uniref:selenocysteine-specific translation elongation factor n=1 Tax=Helicobacter sp. 16-1353 TaxID=2004996 RepID=UPI0015EE47DB|nr:selenocysteine-specific translation elongation factor [Helicobacter sp. 16-1353]